MLRTRRFVSLVIALFVTFGWCANATADPGTVEDRAALFDYILKATMERTAFSPFKPRDITSDTHITEAEYIRNAMLALRDEFLAADTDAKLYHALVKLTCARWDAHLSRIRLVPGGMAMLSPISKSNGQRSYSIPPNLNALLTNHFHETRSQAKQKVGWTFWWGSRLLRVALRS